MRPEGNSRATFRAIGANAIQNDVVSLDLEIAGRQRFQIMDATL
jgi:hypothetical protein